MKSRERTRENVASSGQKGFSFILDALVAAVILLVAIAFVSTSMLPQDYSLTKMAHKFAADDMLKTGIDANIIQGLNSSSIDTLFSSYISPQYKYRLEVKRYILNAGTYNLDSTFYFGDQITQLSTVDYVESRKVFYTYSGNAIGYYNSAKLDVWVRKQ
ncbi:MAG: hypothetical protein AABW59_01515 [archaeon]